MATQCACLSVQLSNFSLVDAQRCATERLGACHRYRCVVSGLESSHTCALASVYTDASGLVAILESVHIVSGVGTTFSHRFTVALFSAQFTCRPVVAS